MSLSVYWNKFKTMMVQSLIITEFPCSLPDPWQIYGTREGTYDFYFLNCHLNILFPRDIKSFEWFIKSRKKLSSHSLETLYPQNTEKLIVVRMAD